ncbi:S24 family peptidase [Stenotrophomonas tumulicola]|uniref:Helix-turn-helix transcriptional regulator n=1 Tax=Stenotrophomonas tumulicola TaxID=1685415 RepID=A0A7W3FJA4_9GAMM|nr:S24 family peptidase [Stenotrophomonas tumulicola]MBA8680490.1 helix-turn-helix transcriptional regulator [Stenotrophomonas tumulicola]
MELNERVSAARLHAQMTQAQLAKAAGVSQQAIQKLESGKSKDSKRIAQIAIACGVRVEWLTSEEPPMVAPVTPLSVPSTGIQGESDWADVTGYSQAAGLGTGVEAEEYAETHTLKFKRTSLRRRGIHNRPLAIYYGKGDSMEPTIEDGDAILFDTSDTRVADGALYLIQLHGAANAEYYVKRAMVLDGITYFTSDNPSGDHQWQRPRRMDSEREPITVVGRVHWIGGWAD